MRALNFLFAVDGKMADERLLQNLRDKLVKEINATMRIEAGRFDFVFNKNNLGEKIASGIYDVVLCSEIIGEENIGAGSIRKWREEMPQVQVILLVGAERKGGPKLKQLITRLGYTNVLYRQELNGANVVALVEDGRTLEQAVAYYGVEDAEEVKEMVDVPSASMAAGMEEAVTEEGMEIPAEGSEETEPAEGVEVPVGTIIEEFVPEEDVLEDAINAYSDFSAFEEEKEEESADNSAQVNEVAEDSGFDFKQAENSYDADAPEEEPIGFSFFNEEKTADVAKEVWKQEKEEFEAEFIEETDSCQTEVYTAEENSAVEAEEIKVGGLMAGTVKEQIIVTKGYVSKVIDYDSILLEFISEEDIAGVDLQEYRFLVRIKSGRRGGFENGRYKSANISLEAYAEYMVGRQTVMLAVADFNCEINRGIVECKECDVVMTKMQ